MKHSWGWIAAPIAVAVVAVLVAPSAAQPTGPFYEGKLKYGFRIEKLFDDADSACKDGVAQLAKNGNHQQFIRSKDGSTVLTKTCVLKDLDAKPQKQWDQKDTIHLYVKYNDG